MYVHVGDIHRVTPCIIVRYTDYVCETQNLFYELTLNYRRSPKGHFGSSMFTSCSQTKEKAPTKSL